MAASSWAQAKEEPGDQSPGFLFFLVSAVMRV